MGANELGRRSRKFPTASGLPRQAESGRLRHGDKTPAALSAFAADFRLFL
jgi:hypothetical protein